MNIQEEIQNIHRQYGITELANYKIQQLFEKYAKEYCKEQFAKFEEYAFDLKINRDGYSMAKIIELLIEKAKELFVIKNDNVPTGFIDLIN